MSAPKRRLPNQYPTIGWMLDRASPEPNSGCWLWLGSLSDTNYGRVRLPDGTSHSAHRLMYEVDARRDGRAAAGC